MNGLRIIILACVCILFACNLKDNQLDKKETLPNIIFILADDMGYGDVGVFNEDCKIRTPNLDQMAADGMIFTDAHSTSGVCTPTRYGVITGRYSWRSKLKNGVLTGKSKALIPKDRSTVASMLKQQGYHTAVIGKWHLGWDWALKDQANFGGDGWSVGDCDNIDFTKEVTHTPNDLGFDYAYAISGSLDMAPYVYVENGKVTSQPDTVTVDKGKYTWWREGPTGSDFEHEDVTPNLFRRSLAYIKEQSETKDPFFLYLPLPSPHTPILPTEEWLGKSINPYTDFVEMIDNYVGMMISTTKEEGIESNTLIMFMTDNGCSPEADFDVLSAAGHSPGYIYRGHKADIYEGGHRVPCIAKWPDKIQAGGISDALVGTQDLMSTCAAISNYQLKDDEAEDSFSLLPLFENQKGLRSSFIHHSINGSFAIRQGDYKLIMCGGSGGWSYPSQNDKAALDTLPPIQLYNLKNDPSETKNIVDDEPEKVKSLKALLKKQIEDGRTTPGSIQDNDSFEGEWKQIAFIEQ